MLIVITGCHSILKLNENRETYVIPNEIVGLKGFTNNTDRYILNVGFPYVEKK